MAEPNTAKLLLSDNPIKTLIKNSDDSDPGGAPDPLVDSLIQQESGGDPDAVSPAGAVGLAQSMPATARDPGYGVDPLENPRDPQEARRFAKDYMGAMLQEFDDPGHALMAYNWGVGNTKRWLKSDRDTSRVPKETRDYVRDLGPKAAKATGRDVDTPFYSSDPTGESTKNNVSKFLLSENPLKTMRDGTATVQGQPRRR